MQGFNDDMCLHIPRTMFQFRSIHFSDVTHGDQTARFDEITLQLFLQMIHITATTGNLSESKQKQTREYFSWYACGWNGYHT